MYCTEFELSSCGKKICCLECEQGNCQERCHSDTSCKSRTEEKPVGFMEEITI